MIACRYTPDACLWRRLLLTLCRVGAKPRFSRLAPRFSRLCELPLPLWYFLANQFHELFLPLHCIGPKALLTDLGELAFKCERSRFDLHALSLLVVLFVFLPLIRCHRCGDMFSMNIGAHRALSRRGSLRLNIVRGRKAPTISPRMKDASYRKSVGHRYAMGARA